MTENEIYFFLCSNSAHLLNLGWDRFVRICLNKQLSFSSKVRQLLSVWFFPFLLPSFAAVLTVAIRTPNTGDYRLPLNVISWLHITELTVKLPSTLQLAAFGMAFLLLTALSFRLQKSSDSAWSLVKINNCCQFLSTNPSYYLLLKAFGRAD